MNNNNFSHEPDDKEIDMMLKYLPAYTEHNAKNIKNKFAQKAKINQKKLSFKKLILIGAVASMIFATTLVYAGVIDISQIYTMIFGENTEYLEQYIEPLTHTDNISLIHENNIKNQPPLSIQSEYDGIVMKLISAINDENRLLIFATITDTTGDRLGESLDFTSWGLGQGHGGNISVIDYNNQTKTATLMITSLKASGTVLFAFRIRFFSISSSFFLQTLHLYSKSCYN